MPKAHTKSAGAGENSQPGTDPEWQQQQVKNEKKFQSLGEELQALRIQSDRHHAELMNILLQLKQSAPTATAPPPTSVNLSQPLPVSQSVFQPAVTRPPFTADPLTTSPFPTSPPTNHDCGNTPPPPIAAATNPPPKPPPPEARLANPPPDEAAAKPPPYADENVIASLISELELESKISQSFQTPSLPLTEIEAQGGRTQGLISNQGGMIEKFAIQHILHLEGENSNSWIAATERSSRTRDYHRVLKLGVERKEPTEQAMYLRGKPPPSPPPPPLPPLSPGIEDDLLSSTISDSPGSGAS